MSMLRKDTDKKGKTTKREDKREAVDTSSNMADTQTDNNLTVVLTELKNLRKEHTEASQDTKTTLSRVESTLKDVLERTTKFEQQLAEVEQRVSDMEDNTP